MKLRLIEGGAGTGKTTLCLQEIAERLREQPLGAPLLLLVPEQATFQSERALTELPGVSASLRAQAVGFAGLYRLLGAEQAFPVLPRLDDRGRSMLLLACLRRVAGDLEVLRDASGGIGLVDGAAEALVEFEQYNILPRDLLNAAERASNELLGGRLRDLALIYRTYLQTIEGGFRDQGVMMSELAAAAADSRLLEGAELWLDGFLDLNPSQMDVLAAIMPKARTVNVCLCLPDKGAQRIFDRQQRLGGKLRYLAETLGAEVEVVHLLKNQRHRDNAELAAVEEAFAAGGFGAVNEGRPQHIRLLAAADPHDEVAAAARIISELCGREGYCFRDIAVITRSIGDYRVELNNVFRDFGIPFFLDMGEELGQHPLLKLLFTVLAVLTENWSLGSVLAYMKSGLAPLSAEEADVLDNYVRRVGLRGHMWQQAGCWRRGRADELPLINELAARAAAPLLRLQHSLPEQPTVADMVQGLLGLLDELRVADRLAEWQQRAMADGELRLADAHRQILPQVEQLLGQMAAFLGDTPGDAAQFAELLSEGAARLELNSIPPSLNEVTVAEVSRSRLPEIRAAIVLGMNEGVMPLVMTESGFFNSAERRELAGLGLNLAPGGREQQFLEDYYVYIALTRSSERLYLLYSESGADGAARQPSLVLADLRRVLPGLPLEHTTDMDKLGMLGGDRMLLTGLTEHLARLKAGEPVDERQDAFWRGVCRRLQQQGRLQTELAMLAGGLAYRVDRTPLDKRRLRALYPRPDTTSVSRLEKFNTCPCKYYASYGLGLQPREEFQLRPVDVGTLYHHLLAAVMQRLLEQGCDWAELTAEQVELPVLEVLEEFVANDPEWHALLADSARNSYARQKMVNVVCRSILDMSSAFALGQFRPVAFELDFGMKQDAGLASVDIELPDGRRVSLRGQIDRIDAAAGADSDFVRVVDYKMQNKTLRLADIYYGLNWQLPLYLEALLQNGQKSGRKLAPAGMFYIPVQEIIKSVKSAGESGDALKLQGLAILDIEALTLAERDLEPGSHTRTMQVHLKKDMTYGQHTLGLTPAEYKLVQRALRQMVAGRLDEMLSGDISQRPIAPQGKPVCEYCDYYPMCAVDLAVESDVRPVENLSTSQVMERLAAEYGGMNMDAGINDEINAEGVGADGLD